METETPAPEGARSTRRLATAGLIGIAGVAVGALLGWMRAKGLALTLEPAGIGRYGQLSTFALYAGTVGALGIGIGTTRYVAAKRAMDDKEGLSAVATLSLGIPLAVGLMLLLAALATAPWTSLLIIDAPEWQLVALASLSIPLVAIQAPLQHLIQGFEDVRGQTICYLAYGAGFTVLAIAGAAAAGVSGALVGLLLGNALLGALYLGRGRQLLRRAGATFGPRIPKLGDDSRDLIKIGAASLAVTVAFSAGDLAVRTSLIHAEGDASAGLWYAMMLISVQFVGALYGATSYLSAPLLAHSAARNDTLRTRSILDDSLRLTLLAVIPVIGAIAALRSPLSRILFSNEFEPMARYLPALMAGDAMRGVAWTLGVALVPLGLTRSWLWTGMGTSVIFGAIGALAASEWGIGGAVVSWIAAWTVTAVATALVLVASGLWRPSSRLLPAFGIVALALASGTLWPGGLGFALVLLLSIVGARILTRESERDALTRWARGLPRRGRTG